MRRFLPFFWWAEFELREGALSCEKTGVVSTWRFFFAKPSHDSSARNVTAIKVLGTSIWYCLDSVSAALPLPTAEIVQKGGSSVIRSAINIDGSEILRQLVVGIDAIYTNDKSLIRHIPLAFHSSWVFSGILRWFL